MTKKNFYDLAIVALVVLLGILGYYLAPLLQPKTDVTVPLVACDLNTGPCHAELPGGGRLAFSITPRPVPALKTLGLEASVTGAPVQKVEVDFAGVDMKMGFNRPALNSTGPGTFSGQASLPVCTTGKMLWQATVLVDTGRQVIALPFRFETEGS